MKTWAVKNCPTPLTPTDIRSFLGLAGHYRKFLDGYAYIDSPLTTLRQKSVKLESTEACKKTSKL